MSYVVATRWSGEQMKAELIRSTATKSGSLLQNEKWYGYLFISPMVLGFLIFLLGPIIAAFFMRFTNWALIKDFSFVGFDNYVNAFSNDPIFWETVGNTLYFSAGLVPLNLIIALGLA